MRARTQTRRRGRGLGLRGLLVDRDEELALLARRLEEVRDGSGGVVLIEAPAGKGKSRLLTAAGDMAREADMQVLGAQGTELERDFPFGVAIQLFEPRWIAAGAAERARLAEGAAARAVDLLMGDLPASGLSPSEQAYAVMHGLFWLTCNMALPAADGSAGAPLLMLVDDAHYADAQSLRFLAYLANRIAELPVGLVVTIRAGEATADKHGVVALRNAAEGEVLHPGLLSPQGVAEIVRASFPDADEPFCRACARVTNGNPFLLTELLGQVEAEQQPPDKSSAIRLAERAPESVLHAVLVRLEALPDDARRVALAVSVLGDGARLTQVASLCGLDNEEVSHGADALAVRNLFCPGLPLAFVHPLIASAVRESMSPLDRAAAHRRAAAILAAEGAPEEQVAAHLLVSPPESDQSAVHALRIAARKALARGAADSAVRLLERAVAEPPRGEVRPEVLAELAQAESAAGLPTALQRLEDALGATDVGARRAELSLARGLALYDARRFAEAATVLESTLEDRDELDRSLVDELDAAFIAAALAVPDLQPEGRERGEILLARVHAEPSAGQRHALAQMAFHESLQAGDRATVQRLAALAWSGGAALEADAPQRPSWPLIATALEFVDQLERSLEVCDRALEGAQDSPGACALASYCRAWPLYDAGRVVEAAADAHASLDGGGLGWRHYLRCGYGAIALCHLERGRLDQAETALSIIEHPDVRHSPRLGFLLDVRAQLRLAQLRPEEARQDALQAGRQLEQAFGEVSPGAVAWRSTAALAHIALGDARHAQELAAEELELARRGDITRSVIRNLRVLGLAQRGEAGLELLEEAVLTGERNSSRLEHVRALLDLGAALRRANKRAAARAPLRRALELSHRGGAAAVAERARAELAATGARPRRVMLSGVESLTPSERRVAEVAAKGLTTRQIAEALFVTPKTVEFHLRHIYRKLDIGSRTELTDVMADEEGR